MIRFKSNELSWDGFLVSGIHGSIVRDIHCVPQYFIPIWVFLTGNILLQVWQRWEIAGTVGTTTGQPNEREDAILYVSTVLLYIQAIGGWSRHVPLKIKLHNHIGERPLSLLRVRMVISATPKTSCHTRLISLPSKTLHLIVTAEEQWYWLKASEATSTSSSSSSPSVIIPWLGDLRNS